MASGGDKGKDNLPPSNSDNDMSENADQQAASPDEASTSFVRRQEEQTFPSPISASPPMFVTLEEIMKAAKGVNDMVLAHEIAVDNDFELKKMDPPENSLEKKVKDTMHKVFWDIFAKNLAEDPPNYSHAMVLLSEIREFLFSLLLPQHTKLMREISEVLDIDLIQQQVDAGTLDFEHYAQYVISVMSKLCAPIRDDEIRKLKECKDTLSVFKGIIETLELMKLDMANFTIKVLRPNIVAKSVEYEKEKFAKFLMTQEDGLHYTREWLLRHRQVAEEAEIDTKSDASVKNLTQKVLSRAYLELLDWDAENVFPETLLMDQTRFLSLGERSRRLTILGTIQIVATNVAVALYGNSRFKDKLKNHLIVLISDIHTHRDLPTLLPSIAVQVVKDVNDSLAEHGFKHMDETVEKALNSQILELANSSHRVRQLVWQRIVDFVHLTITSPTAAPVQVPPGLSFIQTELTTLTGEFLRIVSHNRAVYGEYYYDIIQKMLQAQ